METETACFGIFRDLSQCHPNDTLNFVNTPLMRNKRDLLLKVGSKVYNLTGGVHEISSLSTELEYRAWCGAEIRTSITNRTVRTRRQVIHTESFVKCNQW
jgi:hypothetical protein